MTSANDYDMRCPEVGFGDMVPSKSFLGYEESLFGKLQVNFSVRVSDKQKL